MTHETPKLLFLCHTLPYPPDGGVWIRSFNTLRQLDRAFDVTALFFERTGRPDHDVDHAVEQLSQLAPTEVFSVPQDGSALRKAVDHTASLLTGRVFTIYKHRSGEYRRRLERLVATGDFALAHVDSIDLATHLPLLRELPVVLVHHNVESQLLRRRSEAEGNPLARWYVSRQARLQMREERRWCPCVDINVTVSEQDRETFRSISPDARYEVIPNGVDVRTFTPAPAGEDEQGLVFVGGAGWFPNRDGMEYFANDILPRIRDMAQGDPSVTWVGGADEALRDRFDREHGVNMTGYVDDIREYVRSAACYVVPLRVGGGSRLKILDAWAMGKAIVSTSRGCEGLDVRDGENMLVRDDPDSFARAVVRLLEDDSRRRRLGRMARQTAVEKYSWEIIGDKMIRVYRSLLQ